MPTPSTIIADHPELCDALGRAHDRSTDPSEFARWMNDLRAMIDEFEPAPPPSDEHLSDERILAMVQDLFRDNAEFDLANVYTKAGEDKMKLKLYLPSGDAYDKVIWIEEGRLKMLMRVQVNNYDESMRSWCIHDLMEQEVSFGPVEPMRVPGVLERSIDAWRSAVLGVLLVFPYQGSCRILPKDLMPGTSFWRLKTLPTMNFAQTREALQSTKRLGRLHRQR